MWLFFFFANERQDEKAAKFCFSSNLWEDVVAEKGVSVNPEMGRAPPSGASGLVHDRRSKGRRAFPAGDVA